MGYYGTPSGIMVLSQDIMVFPQDIMVSTPSGYYGTPSGYYGTCSGYCVTPVPLSHSLLHSGCNTKLILTIAHENRVCRFYTELREI